MNFEITEATQSAINPGVVKDTFYPGATNLSKQAFPVVKNNRFRQQFPNKSAGTSQFIISPNEGVSDMILRFQMPAADSTVTYTNACLAEGWGYSLIRTISVRYGGSSQYFWTGSQMCAQNLLDSENQGKTEQILKLGGTFKVGADCANAEALVYLNLPHNTPRAEGKTLPLPSDLLTQPIVITVELNNISSVFAGSNSTAPSGLPTSLYAAELQVSQEYMSDSADLLARRVDMNTHAQTFPLKYFAQQEVINTYSGTTNDWTATQEVILSGFRAGEVRDIMLWLEVQEPTGNFGAAKQWIWYPLQSTELRYNGEVFFTSDGSSSQLWNLVEDKKIPGFNTGLVNPAGNPTTVSQFLSTWTLVKFSQVDIPRDRMYDLISGKPILNAVVNLSFKFPSEVRSKLTSGSKAVLHAVYMYNASLVFSRGTTEYVF